MSSKPKTSKKRSAAVAEINTDAEPNISLAQPLDGAEVVNSDNVEVPKTPKQPNDLVLQSALGTVGFVNCVDETYGTQRHMFITPPMKAAGNSGGKLYFRLDNVKLSKVHLQSTERARVNEKDLPVHKVNITVNLEHHEAWAKFQDNARAYAMKVHEKSLDYEWSNFYSYSDYYQNNIRANISSDCLVMNDGSDEVYRLSDPSNLKVKKQRTESNNLTDGTPKAVTSMTDLKGRHADVVLVSNGFYEIFPSKSNDWKRLGGLSFTVHCMSVKPISKAEAEEANAEDMNLRVRFFQ